MKIAFFGDVHCSIRKEFNEHSDRTGSTRLDRIVDTLNYIKDYCVENSVQKVVCTGDLFHVRSKIDVRVFNAVHEVIKGFSRAGLELFLVAGNHDDVDNSDTPQSSLRTFGDVPNVMVVECCHSFYLHHGLRLHCAPYSKNTELTTNFINSIDNDGGIEILVAHLGVSGATVGSSNYPMQDAFSLGDLRPDCFKYVALGHYHDMQFLGDTKHMFYTGSPIAHDFSDTTAKGFMVVDTSKRWDVQFIEIQNPKFVTVDSSISTEELELHTQQGNYLRVCLMESEVDEFKDRVPQDLKYKIELQKEFKCEQRIDISVGMDFNEVVSKYAEEFMPESKEIGLKILAEVENL